MHQFCLEEKKKGKKGYATLKLDVSKAFDRIEWNFLKSIMIKLGFNDMFTSLIMNCITFVCFSIIINGTPKDMISPSRGLRQSDPL